MVHWLCLFLLSGPSLVRLRELPTASGSVLCAVSSFEETHIALKKENKFVILEHETFHSPME